MRGEFLDLNGVRLYYYAAGSRGAGEPIVLLHGFPTSGHVWSDVVPLLPAGHRVVVLDLLGYGRSDPPGSHGMGIAAHGERLLATLDHLGIRNACLVGHGLGGGVALWLAVRHRARVSRLALVASVAFEGWPPIEVRLARKALPLLRHMPSGSLNALLRMELLRGYVDRERGSHEIELYLRPFAGAAGRVAMLEHLAALDRRETESLTSQLPSLACPTAVLWGDDDPFLPAALGRRLAAAIPGGSLEVLTGARHFLPEENAGGVAACVRALLERPAGGCVTAS